MMPIVAHILIRAPLILRLSLYVNETEALAQAQFAWLKGEYEKRLIILQKKKDSKNIERVKYALENMKVYTSFDKMLDETEGNLDLIDNCTHGRAHVQLAIQAMDQGVNAMAEKPPALNFMDARWLVKMEEKSGKRFQLSEQMRFEPVEQKMRKLIATGILGSIKHLQVRIRS